MNKIKEYYEKHSRLYLFFRIVFLSSLMIINYSRGTDHDPEGGFGVFTLLITFVLSVPSLLLSYIFVDFIIWFLYDSVTFWHHMSEGIIKVNTLVSLLIYFFFSILFIDSTYLDIRGSYYDSHKLGVMHYILNESGKRMEGFMNCISFIYTHSGKESNKEYNLLHTIRPLLCSFYLLIIFVRYFYIKIKSRFKEKFTYEPPKLPKFEIRF